MWSLSIAATVLGEGCPLHSSEEDTGAQGGCFLSIVMCLVSSQDCSQGLGSACPLGLRGAGILVEKTAEPAFVQCSVDLHGHASCRRVAALRSYMTCRGGSGEASQRVRH